MLKRLLNWCFPMCPSGKNHRVSVGVVTNFKGHKFCWHHDCMTANFAECNPAPTPAIAQALRDIGLALNATHGTVATDMPDAQPNATSWRVDHTRELAQLDVLENALLPSSYIAP